MSETEKQAAMRQAEKKRYLAGLKAREADRNKSKEQLKQSEAIRAQGALADAKTYLEELNSRSEVRAGIKEKMIEDAKTNHEIMEKQGQLYRQKLQGFAAVHQLKAEDIDRLLDKESE